MVRKCSVAFAVVVSHFIVFSKRLGTANSVGRISQENGEIINARTERMLTKQAACAAGETRGKDHLRSGYKGWITRSQRHFFNNRKPIWTCTKTTSD